MAIIKVQRGYHLVFWDPDPNPKAVQPKARISHVLRGLQKRLWSVLRKKSCNYLRVWYRIREDRNAKGQCLRHTMELLQELVEIGGREWEGDGDKRVEGCVELTYQ